MELSTISTYNCTNTAKDTNITTTIAKGGIMWFLLFAVPLVAILGIIGNIFSFVILKESALKNVSHFYLACLSVFDSITLITILYTFYGKVVLYPILIQAGVYSPFLNFVLNEYAFCAFRMYSTFTMRVISIWTIVLYTIDRFIAVAFPLRSRNLSTVRNTIIVISSLVGFSICINIPWIFSYSKVPLRCTSFNTCKFNKTNDYMIFAQFVFMTLIPSIIISICNVSIVYLLRKRQRHSTLVNKVQAMNQERMITIRLLLVSTAFVVLMLPSLVIISINTEHKMRMDDSYKRGHKANALHIGLFLFTVNLSINFILYCLTGENFRRAALSILRCKFDEMRYYRRVILNPNILSDTNVTDVTEQAGRNNSVPFEKTELVTKKSSFPIVLTGEVDGHKLIVKTPSETSPSEQIFSSKN